MLQQIDEKMQNSCQRHQKVLWHFLAMLATIKCIYARVFDCAHPQGVQRDSLQSLKPPGPVQGVETPVLHTDFACAAPPIVLYVFQLQVQLEIHLEFHLEFHLELQLEFHLEI